MVNGEYQTLKAALEWHLDAGADFPLSDTPDGLMNAAPLPLIAPESVKSAVRETLSTMMPVATQVPLGASEARAEAVKLAQGAQDLESLRAAIAAFDGIGLKGTATNLVFAAGHPGAPVMIIGDAPGADDDRAGIPFAPGMQGQLLDRMMAAVGLNRAETDPAQSLYISHILNWRPPGGRSPAPTEIEVSLPFIERHIQLAAPRILVLTGGVAAKALLGESTSISKLRGRWHSYLPQTPELRPKSGDGAVPILALAVFDPAYILENPAQKRPLWADLLMLLDKRRELGLVS